MEEKGFRHQRHVTGRIARRVDRTDAIIRFFSPASITRNSRANRTSRTRSSAASFAPASRIRARKRDSPWRETRRRFSRRRPGQPLPNDAPAKHRQRGALADYRTSPACAARRSRSMIATPRPSSGNASATMQSRRRDRARGAGGKDLPPLRAGRLSCSSAAQSTNVSENGGVAPKQRAIAFSLAGPRSAKSPQQSGAAFAGDNETGLPRRLSRIRDARLRTSPNFASASRVIGPARSTSILPSRGATTVDSMPCWVAPPSTISGIRPDNSSSTSAAEVGLMRPKRFALGAASGCPKAHTFRRRSDARSSGRPRSLGRRSRSAE